VDLPVTLTEHVTAILRRALRRADTIDAEALTEFALPPRQYAFLALLENGPVARQHEVGAALGLDRTTTAALVRRLVDRGLVERTPQPGNGRTLVLELTPAGELLRAAGARRLRACEEEILAPLTVVERRQLRGMLGRLAGA
jgi:DNA-binding MarR family transcriptional regulator